MTAKRIDASLFDRAVLLTISLHAWRNNRQGNTDVLKTGDVKKIDWSLMRMNKKLVESPAYDRLIKFQWRAKDWCADRAMPSYIQEGTWVVKNEMVDDINNFLRDAQKTIQDELVPAFLKEYPACKDVARQDEKLGPFYREEDYPKESELKNAFWIEWRWIALDVPKNLPPKVRAKEVAKMKKAIADAQVEIVRALRLSFGEIVKRMVERLGKDEEGNPKKFKDSLVENFNSFFDTFDARNLMEDAELSVMVQRAKDLLKNISPEDLRNNEPLRKKVQTKMAEVGGKVDEMIQDVPKRRTMNWEE